MDAQGEPDQGCASRVDHPEHRERKEPEKDRRRQVNRSAPDVVRKGGEDAYGDHLDAGGYEVAGEHDAAVDADGLGAVGEHEGDHDVEARHPPVGVGDEVGGVVHAVDGEVHLIEDLDAGGERRHPPLARPVPRGGRQTVARGVTLL